MSADDAPAGPKITIIVATKNCARLLPGCLDSVLGQDYPNMELIVMDGASTDGTLQVIERYANRLAFWSSEPDTGNYQAWNRAIPRATGDWIAFLGADDRLAGPGVMSRLAPSLVDAQTRRIRVVYGQVELTHLDGRVIELLGRPWDGVRDRFRHEMCLPHPGLMHHRSLFDDHGPFAEDFRVAGDYEFLLRELATHDALHVPGLVTVRMGYGGACTRPENQGRVAREDVRALRRNGLPVRSARLWARVIVLSTESALFRVLPRRAARRLVDAARALVGKPRIWG